MFQIGDKVDRVFILKEGQLKTTNAGSPYLNCTLATKEETYPAVAWDFKGALDDDLVGSFVHVAGRVSSYRDALQIVIKSISRVEITEQEREELVPCTKQDMGIEVIQFALDSIVDKDYKAVVKEVLEKYGQLFQQIPAGRNAHQAGLHGLLVHTTHMTAMAMELADIYGEVVNRDLLLAATICHDIGKLREFKVSGTGLVTDYTPAGNMLGHAYMGAEMVHDICVYLQVPEEKELLLKHCIGSHAGEPDWGAVQKPQIAEATLLNLLDLIDSRMAIIGEAYEKMETGERTWSKYLNTYLFKYTER